MSEKIHLNINASSLRASSCLLHWWRVIHEGYSEKIFNNKIVYGIAGHKYFDTAYKTGNLPLAKEEAFKVFDQPKVCKETKDEHFSDRGHFNYICYDVWTNYASVDGSFQLLLKPDGSPATEVTFSIPYYDDGIISVNLCGTIDKIGRIKGGGWAIGDWKFTGFWDTKQFLASFAMASQLRFYALSLKLMARHFPQSQLGEIGATNFGAFIDGIFIKPKVSECAVKRSDVFQMKDEIIADFEASLLRRIKQLSAAIADGTVLQKEGILMNTCQLKYHPCSFYIPCSANNTAIELMMLEREFKQQEYDPLNRDKEI